jgi:hypothetical protein
MTKEAGTKQGSHFIVNARASFFGYFPDLQVNQFKIWVEDCVFKLIKLPGEVSKCFQVKWDMWTWQRIPLTITRWVNRGSAYQRLTGYSADAMPLH